MASQIKWSTPGSYTTLIDGGASSPTLKNLANNAGILGNAVTTALAQYCSIDLLARFAVAPSVNGTVDVYFVPAVDGTNYADGDGSVLPPFTSLVASIPVRAVTTAQRVAKHYIPVPPFNFKPVAYNKSGQAMTNTAAENVLSYRTYNDESQ